MRFSATPDPTTSLRLALTVNATTSGLGGLAALIAGDAVDDWLGTGQPGWVRVVGAGLVAFALAVAALAHADEQRIRRWVPVVSVADLGWVAASVATVAGGWYSIRGAVIVGVVALAVGTFAVTQTRLHRTHPAPVTRTATPSPGHAAGLDRRS